MATSREDMIKKGLVQSTSSNLENQNVMPEDESSEDDERDISFLSGKILLLTLANERYKAQVARLEAQLEREREQRAAIERTEAEKKHEADAQEIDYKQKPKPNCLGRRSTI
jgi:hypothetical protein